MAAHTAAQAALAAVSEQLASSSYAYADRLRAELERQSQRHADEMLAAHQQIGELRRQIGELQREIDELRRQLPSQVALVPPWDEGTG